MYHVAYGAAFVVLFGGWAIEVRRAGSLSAIADALSMRDALAQLNRGRDSAGPGTGERDRDEGRRTRWAT